MTEAINQQEPTLVRQGKRGPRKSENPRKALELWIYPKPGDMELLSQADAKLQEDGLCKEAKLREGHLSFTEIFLAILRFYRAHSDLPLEPVMQPNGKRGKSAKIGLNKEEAQEWLEARPLLDSVLSKPGKDDCRPMDAMLSLASFYLRNRENRGLPET
ncbi:hypothetical protein F3I62_18790 [Pseudomonas sp. R-28-1W-6]|uniref:hypothetical protein n=1 Tax=Pseudomonas sp. R-28-1W-6 TaxID=2650101 RepID=UPI001365AA16|nr:hypothetical protein [Pseudomonas sp. R-28-1W-6]MWV14152.1 hypothetical protein [Pseudomonas sp. R-28-1W-6]